MELFTWIPFVIGFFYIISLYLVWKLCRREYLDEEKVLDLIFLSSIVGIIAAKLVYWLLPFGQEGLRIALSSNNFMLAAWYLVRLDLMTTWVVIPGFYISVLFLIRRWKWPHWPVLGIVTLGLVLFGGLTQAVLWAVSGGNEHLLLLINAIIATVLCIYLLELGGDKYLLLTTDYLQEKIYRLVHKGVSDDQKETS